MAKNRARYTRRQNVAREAAITKTLAELRLSNTIDPQLSAALDDSLANLREGERQVIVMHFYEGLPVRQIAERLGLTRDVPKAPARALASLRDARARPAAPLQQRSR